MDYVLRTASSHTLCGRKKAVEHRAIQVAAVCNHSRDSSSVSDVHERIGVEENEVRYPTRSNSPEFVGPFEEQRRMPGGRAQRLKRDQPCLDEGAQLFVQGDPRNRPFSGDISPRE